MTKQIILKNPNIVLTAVNKKDSLGVVESIRAINSTPNIIRARPYELAMARGLNPTNNSLWNQWFNSNEEQLRVTATKSYEGIKRGDHRLLLIGCSSFSQDTEAMIAFGKGEGVLDGRKKVGLTNYNLPLSQTKQVDKLLGEGIVYVTGADSSVKEQKTNIMTYDQFFEVSKEKYFLLKNQFYVVSFLEKDIQAMKSNYIDIDDFKVRNHQPSIVHSGGNSNWQLLLNSAEKRGYSEFYIGNPDLDKNSGCMGFLYGYNNGFSAYNVNGNGRSVGISPKSLDALVKNI